MSTEQDIKEMRSQLKIAKQQMKAQNDLLEKLTAPPIPYGTLLRVRKKICVLDLDGKTFEVLRPKKLELHAGDTVKCAQSGQIVDVVPSLNTGSLYTVRAVNNGHCEIDAAEGLRSVFTGRFKDEIEPGCRIITDKTGSVVVRNLGKDESRFKVTQKIDVSWDDIGGLVDAKQALRDAIETPYLHAETFARYGQKPAKGVLLYGPPGCGKTMLAKATARAMSEIHGDESSGYIYVKGPEILDRWVGSAEATIRSLFARARDHYDKHGYPAVVFIDEADAILGKRGSGISSDMERTIVPQFLSEMDGLDDSKCIMLLATNRPDTLDSAVVRDGRIDRKVRVTRPDQESAAEIFRLHLSGRPKAQRNDALANVAVEHLFSDEFALYKIGLVGGEALTFKLSDLSSGAMIAGIVQQATMLAIHREIDSGDEDGITREDLIAAVKDTFNQNCDLNHSDALVEFTHDYKDDVSGVTRLRTSH